MPDYPTSFGLDAEADLFTAVAEGFHDLARSLDGAGLTVVGLRLHEAASMLDLGLRQRGWWTNGFNGQEGRGRLFRRILDTLRPAALIETGTFRGSTTAIMAQQFGGPIFTCEVDPRWFLTSKATLERFPQVDVRNLDSRGFLRTIVPEMAGDPLFYYLDAHWHDDLPLPEEIEFVLSRGRPAVIVIDDFAVPWDAGYAFDDYGPGKALTIDLLARLENRGAGLFFPTLPAEQETGARRGCAVIATACVVAAIDELPELRRHDWPVAGGARDDVPGSARDSIAGSARSNVPGMAEDNAAPAAAPAQTAPPDLSPLRLFASIRGLEQERDTLRGTLHHAAAERDALLQERDALIQERAALLREHRTLLGERDALLGERDTLLGEQSAWCRRGIC
jgi:predicted O-methyltransferase YrrM